MNFTSGRTSHSITALGAILALAACGGGGAAAPGVGAAPPVTPPITTPPTPPNGGQTPSTASGIAYLPSDGTGTNAIEVIQYEDTAGNVLAKPIVTPYTARSSIGQIVASADGSIAAVAESAPSALFNTQIQPASITGGQFALMPGSLDVSQSAGNIEGISLSADGSVMAIQGDNLNNVTVAVAGISTGTPSIFAQFALPSPPPPQFATANNEFAVAISPDDKTIVTRGDATSFYAMTPTGNSASPMTIMHVADINLSSGTGLWPGRGIMAFDPQDGSRILFGSAPQSADLTLVTGLPQSPTVGLALTLPIATVIQSVAFTPDGKYAIVGSTNGLFVVSGASTGALAIVPQGATANYTGTFAASDGSTQQMVGIASVGVSNDGKFVDAVADYNIGPKGSPERAFIAIPISANGTLGSIAVALPGVNRPYAQNADFNLFR